jgi:hypothetical protein
MCKKRQELLGIGGSGLTSKTVVPQGLPRVCVHRSRGLSEPIHVEVLDAANVERVGTSELSMCRRAVDVPATERVQSRSHIVEFVVVKVG